MATEVLMKVIEEKSTAPSTAKRVVGPISRIRMDAPAQGIGQRHNPCLVIFMDGGGYNFILSKTG
jgi:hypothetical protein